MIQENLKKETIKKEDKKQLKESLKFVFKKDYLEAVGRRKESIARVRISKAKKGQIIINGKELNDYFKTEECRKMINDVFVKTKTVGQFDVVIKVKGGGFHSQAEAIRHGLARVIAGLSSEFHQILKKVGYLKRDARTKERRKPGLKKARKSPRWSKR